MVYSLANALPQIQGMQLMKKIVLTTLALLLLADSARGDRGQPSVAPQQVPYMLEQNRRFNMPFEKWQSLKGKTKAEVFRRVGSPVRIDRDRNGTETWSYGRAYFISFRKGIAIDADIERQTSVLELSSDDRPGEQ